ncbi:hypothetical protein CKO_04867 [Citrobacter koseri ATCC BAA-895]|uniref:Uncharacterized protein n=1 Tax=Citrobacter koseri (strain ATCC BAA-895 / CDC 4225-83 / SGSC4696) TaxID=290338 RepID=A8AQZ8_CITK8|nr:hypothetical protein CKO_04867 [Citrobacter koseri ATCC BAA-895]
MQNNAVEKQGYSQNSLISPLPPKRATYLNIPPLNHRLSAGQTRRTANHPARP